MAYFKIALAVVLVYLAFNADAETGKFTCEVCTWADKYPCINNFNGDSKVNYGCKVCFYTSLFHKQGATGFPFLYRQPRDSFVYAVA